MLYGVCSKSLAGIALLGVALVGSSAVGQTTWHVDAELGNDQNVGDTWPQAFKTVQKALSVADSQAPDVIWVAKGTYYPDEGPGQADGDRTATFALLDRVPLFGGFPTGGSDFGARDPEAFVTILSGDVDKDDVLDADNSYHVVFVEDIDIEAATINGFTITFGFADASAAINIGGGMVVKDDVKRANIVRCKFTNNYAVAGGAFATAGTIGPVAHQGIRIAA